MQNRCNIETAGQCSDASTLHLQCLGPHGGTKLATYGAGRTHTGHRDPLCTKYWRQRCMSRCTGIDAIGQRLGMVLVWVLLLYARRKAVHERRNSIVTMALATIAVLNNGHHRADLVGTSDRRAEAFLDTTPPHARSRAPPKDKAPMTIEH